MKAILGALAAVALAGVAVAQTGNQQAPVGGHTLEQVRGYVDAVSVASESAGVLGRWNASICPGVVGVTPASAQIVIDQIARRASALGLRTGAPGCRPNISIIITPDADAVAQQIYAQRREMLVGPNGVESTSLGSQALQAFIATSRPIRAWQVSQTVMADGHVLSDNQVGSMHGSGAASAAATTAMASGSGSPSGGGEGVSGADVTRADGTLLRRTTRQDFNFAVVIVDATKLSGAPMTAIADYIAFVTLAQINPERQSVSYPSILNLFDANTQTRPTAMTEWDLGYLDGLYHVTRNARSLTQQQDEIARRIANVRD